MYNPQDRWIELPVGSVPAALELVEDAVVLVEGAQFGAEVLVHMEALDGLGVHVQVPHLYRQVVTADHIAPAVRELDVRDARDDLREEAAVGGVLGLLKHCKQHQHIIETHFLDFFWVALLSMPYNLW